jgi:hypothetical protein
VPAALQAIALKAMERRPADRYQTAADLVRDLDRFLDGQPVQARPTLYATTLGARVRPHMDQVRDWLQLKLIYPHEADKLTEAYQALEQREDDWIIRSRVLSYSQIVPLSSARSSCSWAAYTLWCTSITRCPAWPVRCWSSASVCGLNLAGRWLYRRQHQAVAVAFYLAGVSLLPLFLLIVFQEKKILMAPAGSTTQLFDPGWISNSQLQATVALACGWSGWLAFRTKTSALSTLSVLLFFILALAVLADYGLRGWIENQQFDRLALRLAVLAGIYGAIGFLLDRQDRAWFARPTFIAGALTLVLAVDLLALQGRMFEHLGIPVGPLQPDNVEDATLLPTAMALSLNGALFYAVAAGLDNYGSAAMAPAAKLLFVIAPFSMLEPLAYLSDAKPHYTERFDWLYLGLAVAMAFLSHTRQRKSFYYAGLLNTGVALYLIAVRHTWYDKSAWAITLVVVGLAALVAGSCSTGDAGRPRRFCNACRRRRRFGVSWPRARRPPHSRRS